MSLVGAQALQADGQGAVALAPSPSLQCQLQNASATSFNFSLDAGAQASGLSSDGWRACAANASFAGLADGAYLFGARVADSPGGADAWALSPFEVDRTPPVMTVGVVKQSGACASSLCVALFDRRYDVRADFAGAAGRELQLSSRPAVQGQRSARDLQLLARHEQCAHETASIYMNNCVLLQVCFDRPTELGLASRCLFFPPLPFGAAQLQSAYV